MFRHEYISQVYLPKMNQATHMYHATLESVVPDRVHEAKFCFCGNEKNSENGCSVSSHPIMNEVSSSVIMKKATPKLKKIFSDLD